MDKSKSVANMKALEFQGIAIERLAEAEAKAQELREILSDAVSEMEAAKLVCESDMGEHYAIKELEIAELRLTASRIRSTIEGRIAQYGSNNSGA